MIYGEGELPLLLCLDALARHRPLGGVPGLLRPTGRGDVESNHQVFHDLDVRARFDLEGVQLEGYDLEDSAAEPPRAILDEGSGPLVPYQFNVGCPFGCGFCNSFSRRTYRLRAPALVAADLTHAVREYGVHRFYMVNHLLNADPAHLRERVERLMEKLPGSWRDGAPNGHGGAGGA